MLFEIKRKVVEYLTFRKLVDDVSPKASTLDTIRLYFKFSTFSFDRPVCRKTSKIDTMFGCWKNNLLQISNSLPQLVI